MRRHAGQDKNAGTDNGPYTKRRELHWTQDAAQAMIARFFCEQKAEGFRPEKLASHQLTSESNDERATMNNELKS